MNKNEKRVQVLVYGTHRKGESDYYNLTTSLDTDGCTVLSEGIKIPGISLYCKGFRPIAIRSCNPEAFVICDLLSLNRLSYNLIAWNMDKEGCIEDTVLMDTKPAIIHLGVTIDRVNWEPLISGDWRKEKQKLFTTESEYPPKRSLMMSENEITDTLKRVRNNNFKNEKYRDSCY